MAKSIESRRKLRALEAARDKQLDAKRKATVNLAKLRAEIKAQRTK